MARQLKLSDVIDYLTTSFCLFFFQDVEERPIKRYGSSQSSSDDSSPVKLECLPSPQLPASCSSLPMSSDDEKATAQKTLNDKTSTISSGELKVGESVVSQRDSQLVYSSSSFKNNVNSKNSKSVAPEVVLSPADSAATNEVSEVSDFDAVGEMDRVGGYVSSPSNYGDVFSPLEAQKLSAENAMLINKGLKTPHTQKNGPLNTIRYK